VDKGFALAGIVNGVLLQNRRPVAPFKLTVEKGEGCLQMELYSVGSGRVYVQDELVAVGVGHGDGVAARSVISEFGYINIEFYVIFHGFANRWEIGVGLEPILAGHLHTSIGRIAPAQCQGIPVSVFTACLGKSPDGGPYGVAIAAVDLLHDDFPASVVRGKQFYGKKGPKNPQQDKAYGRFHNNLLCDGFECQDFHDKNRAIFGNCLRF
jgi:hypothetical protein